MVLTAAQMMAFFKNDQQMVIPHDTVIQLQQEWIMMVGDLTDFDKDSLSQLVDNLSHPGGCVPDPNLATTAGAMIPMPVFTFGASHR